MGVVHFDHAKIAAAVRNAAAEGYAQQMAACRTDGERAAAGIQKALTEAIVIQSTVFADAMGGGARLGDVVSGFASHAGGILCTLLAAAAPSSRDMLIELFVTTMLSANDGVRVHVQGTEGGRA